MYVVAICGYRRSGKDYLGKQIASGSVEGWEGVEVESGAMEVLKRIVGEVGERKVYHESFARLLKEEVATILGLTMERLEEVKDEPLPPELLSRLSSLYDLTTYHPPSYRSVLIEHATQARDRNPAHWIEALFKNLDTLQTQDPTAIVTITDLRFRNEVASLKAKCSDLKGKTSGPHFHLLTIRVFRSCVPIPPSNVASEHDLDTTPTSLLLFPPADRDQALTLFPQYRP